MTFIDALILGIIQGLSEFLPVSSSGHIEIGKALLGVETREDVSFTVVVHGATVLSTLVVFRKDIGSILHRALALRETEALHYIGMLAVSMLPVLIVGLFFKDQIEALFFGHVGIVGAMLLITALLLAFTYKARPRAGGLHYGNALLIGLAQAFAVIPGISRSGATISTAILSGVDRREATRFSFLMVLVPILGANFLDIIKDAPEGQYSSQWLHLLIGFLAAFLTGLWACTAMIKVVQRGKLIYFAWYCAMVGLIAIIASIWF
jgi:undecaprenyl-diphosphatase